MTGLPKICFLGLGDHGRRGHLDHLVKMAIYPSIGVYDPKADHCVVSLGHGKELLPFERQEDALEWADAVMICSPDEYHLSQMMAAIDAGCHVFCEKPLVHEPEELGQLDWVLRRASLNGLVVTSCHPRRFDPPYVRLRENLTSLIRAFGPVLEVKLDFSYHKPSKRGLHGGSLLQDHANHEIDYLSWLLGPRGFQAWKLLDEEDRYHLAGVRSDGIVFSFGGTRRLDASTYPESIWLRFERGEAFVDTYNVDNSYVLDHQTRQRESLNVGVTDYNVRFRDLNAHWLDLITDPATEKYLTGHDLKVNTALSVAFKQGENTFSI